MKGLILKFAPIWFQNFAISIFNTMQYKRRHGGKYWNYRDYFKWADSLSEGAMSVEVERRLKNYLDYVTTNSSWYASYQDYKSLGDFRPLEKIDIVKHLHDIATVSEEGGVVVQTGGTTGASMRVLFTDEDSQERHAMLDHFRSQYGYSLGKRCAWFSGKDIVTDKDISKGVCYRDDWINKIRFFSTFKISDKNFEIYWAALRKFKPEFMVGFPSSVYEICLFADAKGLQLYPPVNTYFPTSETVLPAHREVISRVLGCKVVDQYASSEGAPFITECPSGRLHIQPLSGVFEVVDEGLNPSLEGEMLVTSFSTRGTPLVRYRIGDSMRLAPAKEKCSCGSHFPVVERIEGRSTDYILSPDFGKVNLGNISNCTKGVRGIYRFQVHQNDESMVAVWVEASDQFNSDEQSKFYEALVARLGKAMQIDIVCVDKIPKESSGKFRIVKNNLLVKSP